MDLIDRQAAIDTLERKKDKNAKGDIGGFYNKIIQNDIDALTQLPSAQPQSTMGQVNDTAQSTNDCISRQAAIDLVEGLESARLKGEIDLLYTKVVKGLIGLPSARPERKTGYWIEHEWAEEVGGILVSNYECSECHCWKRETSDYCPDCGADMRGEQDEHID